MPGNHFYTTSLAERNNAVASLGYVTEGTACFVWPGPAPGPIAWYRYWSGGASDHFYTPSFSEGANATTSLGYKAEGIAGFLLPSAQAGTVPLFRLWSAGASDHFYTTSAPERDNAVQHLGYKDEGVAGYVHAAATGGWTALYRAYSAAGTDHFYTTSAAERDNAVKNLGYADEGIACYLAASPGVGPQPLYRAYDPKIDHHFYTMDVAEMDNATNNLGYHAEGIAAYIFPAAQAGTVPLLRAFQPSSGDHFYTTSAPELENAVANLGYKAEGTTGFVSPSHAAGSVPLYRCVQAQAWTYLKNQPSFSASTMLLLTDGSVMCQESGGKNWWKLVPDAFGDYVNGSWSQLAAMHQTRLYYASAVLADGRVFVAGGEYSDAGGDTNTAEVYDPTTTGWTGISAPNDATVVPPNPPRVWPSIGDAPCCVLADGRVLLGSIGTLQTAIYDPKANTWSNAANKNDVSSEETWTLLPDGSVLTAECASHPRAERYVPSKNQWVSAGNAAADLVQAGSIEIGPALLLPNGTVFAVGATGHTDLYALPTAAAPNGTWTAGPDLPVDGANLLSEAKDAPGALQPNGRVLFAAGPNSDAASGTYPSPAHIYE
jgi:hypothetical protein